MKTLTVEELEYHAKEHVKLEQPSCMGDQELHISYLGFIKGAQFVLQKFGHKLESEESLAIMQSEFLTKFFND